ncbi:Uncharacterised protein [Mycobacterium tuberculosis]|nr:Uncharacterised protein [Mycobacterium tuberculosis]
MLATSSGVAMRPSGSLALARWSASSVSMPCSLASAFMPSCSLSVRVRPGFTAFTRTPLPA